MKAQPYLIFELQERRYGIDAKAVRELFFLPEVYPLTGAPDDVIGVMNLRGHLVPLLDLSQRLGQGPHPFALSDSIIVLAEGDHTLAIVVSQVFDVVSLAPDTTQLTLLYPQLEDQLSDIVVQGVAQREGEVITLLQAAGLVGQLPLPAVPLHAPTAASPFFPDATPEERHCLKERAANLRHGLEADYTDHLLPLAVVGLQGEQFALPVESIREFTPIREVTPIPCCPSHIVGNMNLRGEILTLLDIRPLLQLPNPAEADQSQAVVVQVGDILAGITVDTVFDVMYIQPSTINPVPVATHAATPEDYLRGIVEYHSTPVSLLDLPKLLLSDDLVVNDPI